MASADTSFLGTGWSFPPTFARASSSVVMVSDDEDIRESLWILFSTSLGERTMLPTYGNQLWKMVFHGITTTLTTQLQSMIAQAILYWEPRINVDDIKVSTDVSVSGLLLITVDYTIRKTNIRSNLVYPFYTQGEQTIPPPPY
ncbi:GPW/gp25 family protein [Bradyrhizobium prioriisuperbiae]|uniref:GPW/gp25 family protein n=1 Tax=Bradyrhizobium prioriisuperbiae TaxID=2854389 RepID=UPI0028E96BD2|nr:GPW/gp25 family protein [Bradyrhizobium prioritasuperba]